MSKIKVAVVGVGNCAAALMQGVEFYKDAKPEDFVPGLMHVVIGDYHVSDMEFVAGFDVAASKVGKDLSEAAFAFPNNTLKFAELPLTGVKVQRGPTLDGFGKYLREYVPESEEPVVDVARVLRESGAEVLINYLPVGSQNAVEFYMEAALEVGVAVVNCMPIFIASNPEWEKRFKEAGLPIIGDDVKSQVGATITHRVLTDLFKQRGVRLDTTYQLNFGGNSDFMNMLERERLATKKVSKTEAVQSQAKERLDDYDIHVGPSDYVPWLEDHKFCYIDMRGTAFGGAPLRLDLKLEVWDSPNSAGIGIDAIRMLKVAMDRGISGVLEYPSAYLMKHPPVQYTDAHAYDALEEWLD